MTWVDAIKELEARVEPLVIGLGVVVGAIFVAGVFLWSLQITIDALIEGRPWSWWVRTDFCPEPNEFCGGMSWIVLFPLEILFVVGLIGVAIREVVLEWKKDELKESEEN